MAMTTSLYSARILSFERGVTGDGKVVIHVIQE
jgi:hypothetical protein